MPDTVKSFKIGFIGAGKVASGMGTALYQSGFNVASVSSRSPVSTRKLSSLIQGSKPCNSSQEVVDMCDLVFITTPDMEIYRVVSSLNWKPGQMVVHTSGADSKDILSNAETSGAFTGVFHPLQTLANTKSAGYLLKGSSITIEADEPLLSTLKAIASTLGAYPLELKPEARILYHASAVFISNYAITLADIASRLWQIFGYDRNTAMQALTPLLKGAVSNLENIGLPHSLTGPISRGDVTTILKHVEALKSADPQILTAYQALGINTVNTALEKGSITPEKAGEMKAIFTTTESEYANNNA